MGFQFSMLRTGKWLKVIRSAAASSPTFMVQLLTCVDGPNEKRVDEDMGVPCLAVPAPQSIAGRRADASGPDPTIIPNDLAPKFFKVIRDHLRLVSSQS